MASTTATHRCNTNTHNSSISVNTHNPNDNYGLTSPHFRRLITHYYNASSKPTVKSIRISPAFLAADPAILCAICKEEFLTNEQTKRLPCKHLYHSQCILPWLSDHTSCPLCRFQLPQHLVDATLSRGISNNMDHDDNDEEGLDDDTMLRFGYHNLDDEMYLQPVFDVGIGNLSFPYYDQQDIMRRVREHVEIDDSRLFIDGDNDGRIETERVLPPRFPNLGSDEGSGAGGEQDGTALWDIWADNLFSVNIPGL